MQEKEPLDLDMKRIFISEMLSQQQRLEEERCKNLQLLND